MQGIQIYLTERILAQPKHNRASMVRQQRGNAFLKEWSKIAAAEGVPGSLPSEVVRRLRPTKTTDGDELMPSAPSNLPSAYREIVRNPNFRPYLELLADEQLGGLMRLGWPEEAGAISHRTEAGGDAEIIREAMARSLGVSVEDLAKHDLATVKSLDFSGTDIRDLSPLAGLTSLSELSLQGTQVGDLSPLAGLASLTWLYLQGTQVGDLSPLAALTSLRGLSLQGTQVGDLSPLAGLASLTRLDLQGTQVGRTLAACRPHQPDVA